VSKIDRRDKAEVAHFLIDQSVACHPGFVGLPKHRLSTLPEVW
jgi:hypothetical protein